MQSRPYFSAAKVDGIPLYEYARRGEFIEVEKVERSIYQFEICDKKNIYPGEVALAPETLKLTPLLLFHTEVGTGTYVRTLFEDFCSKLGGVGHLVALYRDKIGPIGLARALRMQELEHCQELSDLEKYGINPLELLPLPQIWPDQESIKKLKCGQRLSLDLWKTEMTGPYAWAMVNTEYGPSIVGMLESDGAKIRLALHWTAP